MRSCGDTLKDYANPNMKYMINTIWLKILFKIKMLSISQIFWVDMDTKPTQI